MKKYLNLFWAFAQIGVCLFGGGYAMLPLLQRSVVNEHHWATDEEIMDYFAIGQCTPGIIAVNTATFIGYKEGKLAGALSATLGLLTPSIIIITVIATGLQNFAEYPMVQHALSGIRVCVCVLIASAVLKLGKKAINSPFAIVMFVVVTLLAVFTNISSVAIVIGAGIIGYIRYLYSMRKNHTPQTKEGE